MFSITSVAFDDMPPIKPKNNSFVVPVQLETFSRRLADIELVGMYLASNENRLFVPMPHTRTSSSGLPSTVKSKAIATALRGNSRGSQTIGEDAVPSVAGV